MMIDELVFSSQIFNTTFSKFSCGASWIITPIRKCLSEVQDSASRSPDDCDKISALKAFHRDFSKPPSKRSSQSNGNSRNILWHRKWIFCFLTAFLLTILGSPHTYVNACNEAVCASVVSKCTLLRSCDCQIKGADNGNVMEVDGDSEESSCPCCDRCKKCLDYLLTECCSCFDLCPKPINVTSTTDVTQESVVFNFNKPEPQLWKALVEDIAREEDTNIDPSNEQWDTYVYPVDIPHSALVIRSRNEKASKEPSSDDDKSGNSVQFDLSSSNQPSLVTVNCSVAYLRDCISLHKCKASCRTMGATAGRWFEDGCCECVGHHCINYGILESRCSECSSDPDLIDDENVDELSIEELERLEKQYEKALEEFDDNF